MKNIVFTYSLEHKSIDDLFISIFKCIDCLQKETEEFAKLFDGLTCYIGTIESIISQHMLKEEEQVFLKISLLALLASIGFKLLNTCLNKRDSDLYYA